MSLLSHVVDNVVDGQLEGFPYLLGEEPIPHPVARVDAELLPLVPLRLGELGVVVTQREPAEGHMAGLVLHHIGVDGLGQRLLCLISDQPERRQGQALDEHLHRKVCHVPTAIGDRILEERLQVRIQG